jgi:peptidoglycan/xylan/chitin deacetylase (PgdA/CDA1 family)
LRVLYLTFDTEDFISENSVWVLYWILERLKKHDLEALFFITGHMAEKLENFPAIVDLLGEHQIGYHSSSHSVHPTIFEFTDVEDYEQAYRISLERETAHINPLTGEIEGKGGILAVRSLFRKKQVVSFRAPGHCWTPPHLEALRTLGITSDFSTNIHSDAASFKNIAFYPYPVFIYWSGKASEYRILLLSLLRNRLNVLTLHPSLLVNKEEWDSIYRGGNPEKLLPPHPRNLDEIENLLHNFDLLLKQITELEKMHIVETATSLEIPRRNWSIGKTEIEKCYQYSMRWASRQNYEPKFLLNHFFKFFESTRTTY